MDSPAQKLSEQIQLCLEYLHEVLDFPVGKFLLMLGALWFQAWHSPNLETQLLAVIPVIWVVDYVTGTLKAMMRRQWTPGSAFVGLLRGCVWGLLILIFDLLAKFIGGWVFTTILVAITLTETGSVLENVVEMFPGSPLTRLLRALLGLINRRYAAVVSRVEKHEEE